MTLGFYVESVPFTRAVIDGSASLGGSESACLGLARALKALGHDVHIIATQLDEDCVGPDHAGVVWHPADAFDGLNQFIEWDVFTVLRMFPFFAQKQIRARLRVLWNQDMLTQPLQVMSGMWQVDRMVYVSEYQRDQYEDRLKELVGLGWVTKNGYDPSIVPVGVTKDPNRIIHITRPERGLRPLLAMWPALRAKHPHAELRICRYSSMYDSQGWGKICASYDQAVADVNEAVGGITYLGELGKADLYREIAEASVMWYPGVVDFAETSCIAAIESQANWTPFVGSFKGALPETVPSGILVEGNADTPEYQIESVEAVSALLADAAKHGRAYRDRQAAGLEHVTGYTYAAIAAEWDAWITQTFTARAENTIGLLRKFLREDDHVAAKVVAQGIVQYLGPRAVNSAEAPKFVEAQAAVELCDRVIAGKDQTAEHYGQFAMDPVVEMKNERTGRMGRCLSLFEGCTNVLDVACGNGTMAMLLAERYPDLRITGIDYSIQNIERAKALAEELGVADRVTFECAPLWDFDTQEAALRVPRALAAFGRQCVEKRFDGVFVGEFLEHVANAAGLVDYIESFTTPDATIVYTMPHGPFSDLLTRKQVKQRGHVHQFCHDDLQQVFGLKHSLAVDFLTVGVSRRGESLGHWVVQYRAGGGPARPRDIAHRILTSRPHQMLSVGLIVGPNELDLRRCLDSVWGIADEIVIGDCGMDEDAIADAESFGARVIRIGAVTDNPHGFAGARNAVLSATTGDWFLWIDADERMVQGIAVRKYLESGPYVGYSLHQQHLMLDTPVMSDTPVRLFRKRSDIQFYGCVHEQPQMGDANGDIVPTLEVGDCSIAHTGYLAEGIRRDKALRRNLPLLKRDQQVFPERRLGKLLWLRDFVNLSDYEREHAGEITPHCRRLLSNTVNLFEKEFSDPKDKYHALARPWYERALKDLGIGVEIELALAGRRHGLENRHAKPRRIWIRQHAELKRLLDHELEQIQQNLEPKPLRVDPVVAPVVARVHEIEGVPV